MAQPSLPVIVSNLLSVFLDDAQANKLGLEKDEKVQIDFQRNRSIFVPIFFIPLLDREPRPEMNDDDPTDFRFPCQKKLRHLGRWGTFSW